MCAGGKDLMLFFFLSMQMEKCLEEKLTFVSSVIKAKIPGGDGVAKLLNLQAFREARLV
jgi:hypothetical protein